MSLILQQAVSLKSCNAFGVDARAAWFARIRDPSELQQLRDDPRLRALPWYILGAGSNTLFAGDFPGLVVNVGVAGIAEAGARDGARLLRVGASESWPALVESLVRGGRPGLENLALIPGSVGAAVVQNIGAYGLELAERLHSVEVWEAATGKVRTLGVEECGLGYRDSIFKRAAGGIRVILQVTLRLPIQWQPLMGYAELARELAALAHPAPIDVFHAVCALRRRKLPDPAQLGNVGSFFKNPIVSRGQHQELLTRHPSLVSYPMAGGRFKLAAGWLIEACGLRGVVRGAAGVYERQALVLVNHGGASGREILALAREVQETVAARFGVHLEPEAVIV